MANLVMILLVIFLSLPFTNSIRPIYETPTAYEMLEKFNFPKGILPIGIESYKLSSTGEFEVLLKSDCEIRAAGGYYLLKYSNRISGKVEIGSLKSLDGVSVRVFYIWFGVNEVLRNNEDLNFYVGPLSASFSASSFEESPQCRYGYRSDNNVQYVNGNSGVVQSI